MPLPQELVDDIFCQLDVESLRACSLSGSPFRHTSQRILLRSITLDGSTRPSDYVAAHTLLTESPHVVGYITQLTIFLPATATIPETVEEIDGLVQILSLLVNVRRCILEGDRSVHWRDLAPLLSSAISDFLERQPLHELHALDLKMIPVSSFCRLLRAAPIILFRQVSIADVDEDHYHGNPGMVHTLQRLGLKYGTERVCELLAQAQFASEIAALRDLEVSPCGTVTVHVRRLICAAANTLEQIRFVWSTTRTSPIAPLPSLPALQCVHISLGIHDSNQSWFIDTLSSILAPNSSPTLVEIIIAYFPIHQLLHSAPPRIPDAVMSSLDTALSAHPSGPSIKWRLDCFETEFNDFAESVRLGMPRTSENGRLILETYAYHHMLSRIDELPYSP